jgi:hypothetical protein
LSWVLICTIPFRHGACGSNTILFFTLHFCFRGNFLNLMGNFCFA